MYQEALKDIEADVTLNCGKIFTAKVRINNDADIEMLDQLMTLRRLSLILEDNFEKLHMEEFGRMWGRVDSHSDKPTSLWYFRDCAAQAKKTRPRKWVSVHILCRQPHHNTCSHWLSRRRAND